MLATDRRTGYRVPTDMFLNEFISDEPYRALCDNVSETGLLVSRVKPIQRPLGDRDRVVGLEFELPGTGETIWARGEICFQKRGGLTMNDGIRFTAMPKVHARMLRDYCIESRRSHLAGLLARIRR